MPSCRVSRHIHAPSQSELLVFWDFAVDMRGVRYVAEVTRGGRPVERLQGSLADADGPTPTTVLAAIRRALDRRPLPR